MKATYIGSAVVVVLVALGAWFFMSKNTSSGVPGDDAQSAQSQESTSGSLAALAARGGSWKCDVTHTSATETTQGTVYVSGGKVRGDFTATLANAGPMESHMISDGENVYVWSNMMPSGMKMKAAQKTDTGSTDTSKQQDFYNQNYDYRCAAWTEDVGEFTLPTDVTFNDMSAMIPDGINGAANVKAEQAPAGMNCAMCDQAPTADAKAACKTALHCK